MLKTLILAADSNGVIGNENKLPWNLPDDLKLFKKITKGHCVLMGRNTWESLPIRPLKDRCNIVISRNYPNYVESLDFPERESYLVGSIEDSLSLANDLKHKDCFIIGGKMIYDYFIESNLYNNVYLSLVKKKYEGNVRIDLKFLDNLDLISSEDYGDFEFKKFSR